MNLMEMLGKLNLGSVAGDAAVVLIIVLSLIEVSPIRWNPWDRILGWLGKKFNKDVHEELQETRDRLKMVEKQVSDMWVSGHRNAVLIFAREARAGMEHSPDEWVNVLNQAEEYEKYVHEHGITNGIVTQDTEYIRKLYQELSREHRI